MHAPPAKRRHQAAARQAAWRRRREAGELLVRVIVRRTDTAKLTANGYLPASKRNDRHAIGQALETLLDLMQT
jgi:hypothetical protein